MYTTIRRNALKKIEAILKKAVLIRVIKIDDMGDTNEAVTADQAMSAIRQYEADRVVIDDAGSMRVTIHQNWFYVSYPSREVAKAELTEPAFRKYFPVQPVDYAEVKARHPGMILMFRQGDAYELQGDDIAVAGIASIPEKELEVHLSRLLCGGHRVAILDQVQ